VQSQLPLAPEQASNFAPSVDALMVYITRSVCFSGWPSPPRSSTSFSNIAAPIPGRWAFPFTATCAWKPRWIVVPLLLAMTMFAWGAVVYVDYRRAPADTLDIYVIGKQWMWKAQQPTGLKEINELHVPSDATSSSSWPAKTSSTIFRFRRSASRWMWCPALQHHVVPAHQSRPLSFLLLAILRHESFSDGRLGHRHGTDDYAAWLSGASEGNENPSWREKSFLPTKPASRVI